LKTRKKHSFAFSKKGLKKADLVRGRVREEVLGGAANSGNGKLEINVLLQGKKRVQDGGVH